MSIAWECEDEVAAVKTLPVLTSRWMTGPSNSSVVLQNQIMLQHAFASFKLPARQRVEFKILSYVYKCFKNGTAPSYLSSCFVLHHPTRTGLRSSSDTTRLTVQRSTKTLKSGADNRSFTYLAARMWYNLPTTIRESQTYLIFKNAQN